MHFLASPAVFSRFVPRVLPWLAGACVLAVSIGLYLALVVSPPDYQQGETVRIMYIHVPAAMLAMGIYAFMGVASAVFLIWRHTLADVAARACAPLGAAFTVICLGTGMIWGKPMWGAWWVWDARLTSVFILLLLYIGYMALDAALGATERARKALAMLAVAGLVNLPVIKFSVEWWNTLHQPASLIRADGPAMPPEMYIPLWSMVAAFSLFFSVMLLLRMQTALMEQKRRRLVS